MTRPRPKFFYFDLGNVLLHFDHEIGCRNLSELTGAPPQRVRRELLESGLEQRYETGLLTTSQFCDELRSRLETDASDEALCEASSAIFRLNVPLVPLVAHLRPRGVATGVLSNTCEAHWRYCLEHYRILGSAFGVYALSYELGAMKPDAAAYEGAARLAGCAPPEIFFVDDRPENVEAARRAGFDAVPFEGRDALRAALDERGVESNY